MCQNHVSSECQCHEVHVCALQPFTYATLLNPVFIVLILFKSLKRQAYRAYCKPILQISIRFFFELEGHQNICVVYIEEGSRSESPRLPLLIVTFAPICEIYDSSILALLFLCIFEMERAPPVIERYRPTSGRQVKASLSMTRGFFFSSVKGHFCVGQNLFFFFLGEECLKRMHLNIFALHIKRAELV